jgi:hypothetical protein
MDNPQLDRLLCAARAVAKSWPVCDTCRVRAATYVFDDRYECNVCITQPHLFSRLQPVLVPPLVDAVADLDRTLAQVEGRRHG